MKLSIVGCTGRMGCAVIDEASKDGSIDISAGFGKYNNQLSGVSFEEISGRSELKHITTSDNLINVVAASDVVIDFSSPKLSLEVARIVAEQKKALVSGTTGFSNEDLELLQKHSQNSVILWSSNMSIGINLLNILVAKACTALNSNFDTEVIEMHHRYKKDSPSGTAITLGQTIAEAKNLDFDKVSRLSREGIDCERQQDEIGFATLRGGSVVGDHTVIFADDNERIELTHKAVNRNIFAAGAIRAAKWAVQQTPGFYSIKNVIESQLD